jgi:hypothetical protein
LDRFRASPPPPPPPPRPFARCRRPCTLSSPADAARPRQARATTTTMMNEIRLPPAPNPPCARGMLLFAIATFIRLFRLLDGAFLPAPTRPYDTHSRGLYHECVVFSSLVPLMRRRVVEEHSSIHAESISLLGRQHVPCTWDLLNM